MSSPVRFTSSLPNRRLFSQEAVLFYDSILEKQPAFKKWKNNFQYRISLKSGEQLKTLASFEVVLKKMQKLDIPKSTQLSFVAVGGGSVGDFVGFLASVYWRGRPLVHLPSTWLAAIDSAHGGKNGINFLNTKNQLGTFYSAENIYICRQLLNSQPPARLHEALGEVLKTALIDGPEIFDFLEAHALKLTANDIWELLPLLIEKKNKIVARDPFEKNGHRRILNLGHTLGHVLESAFALPHGEAVMLGLIFSVRYSYKLRLLSEAEYIRISLLLEQWDADQKLRFYLKRLTPAQAIRLLGQDKKRTSRKELDFIFVKAVDETIRKKIELTQLLSEIRRQQSEF